MPQELKSCQVLHAHEQLHLEFHPVDMNEGWHTPAG
jgi:hypothetical protein